MPQPKISDSHTSAPAGLSSQQVALAAVLALTFLAYIGTLGFPFVYDDFPQIVHNPFLQSWAELPGYFSARIWNRGWGIAGGAARFYRPVFFLWLLVNRTLFGLHPWGWHLAAVLAHLGVTFLVYRLTAELTRDKWTALIAALVFGAHPVHIEGVAWVSGATEPVLALPLLGSLLGFVHYRKTASLPALASSLTLFALALLAKETALAFPIAVAALCIFSPDLPKREPGVRKLVRSTATAVVPFLVLDVLYIAVRWSIFRGWPAPASPVGLRTMALTWPSVLLFDVKHLVWPANLSLFYDTLFVTSASLRDFWLPVLIVGAIVALLVATACKSGNRTVASLVAFALVWMLATILPTLNLRAFHWREIAHDRYLYLPSVGFVMLLALTIRHLRITEARLFGGPAFQVACTAVLGVTLCASTVYQSALWGSPLGLYYHAATVAPNNVAALGLLADELAARGRLEEAIDAYQRVVRVAPKWGEAWLQLGATSFRAGHYAEAEAQLVRATELDSGNPDAFYVLGLDRIQLQRPREAEAALQQAISLEPSGSGFHVALGSVFERLGNPAAASEFQKELQYHPENRVAHEKLASAPASLQPGSP